MLMRKVAPYIKYFKVLDYSTLTSFEDMLTFGVGYSFGAVFSIVIYYYWRGILASSNLFLIFFAYS